MKQIVGGLGGKQSLQDIEKNLKLLLTRVCLILMTFYNQALKFRKSEVIPPHEKQEKVI